MKRMTNNQMFCGAVILLLLYLLFKEGTLLEGFWGKNFWGNWRRKYNGNKHERQRHFFDCRTHGCGQLCPNRLSSSNFSNQGCHCTAIEGSSPDKKQQCDENPRPINKQNNNYQKKF